MEKIPSQTRRRPHLGSVFNGSEGAFWPHPVTPAASNDNVGSGSYCPQCKKPTTAPIASEYHDAGSIQHRWFCSGCGHRWVTVLSMPQAFL